MTIENDPPVNGTSKTSAPENNGSDENWDDVVFDDTSAAPGARGGKKKRPSVVKLGGAAVALLAVGGAAFYFMMPSDPAPYNAAQVQRPAPTVPQQAASPDGAMIDAPEESIAMENNASMMPPPDDGMNTDNGDMSVPADSEMGMAENNNDMGDDLAAAMSPNAADQDETVEDINLEDLGVNATDTQPLTTPEGEATNQMADNGSADPFMQDDANEFAPSPAQGSEFSGTASAPADMNAPAADGLNPSPSGQQQVPQLTRDDMAGPIDVMPGGVDDINAQDGNNAALEEELMRSLEEAENQAANPPAQSAPTEEVLVNNSGRFDGQASGAPVIPDSPQNSMNEIETDAVVRPQPKDFYVLKQETAPVQRDTRLMSAKRALRSGNDRRALAIFDELYETSPNDETVKMGRAIALQRMNRHEDALNAYEQVLRENPENLDALTNMLGILSRQDTAFSMDKLQRLRQEYPTNSSVAVQLALSKADTGAMPEAIELLNEAYEMHPDSAVIAYNLGVMNDRMRQYPAAARFYRQALDLAGRNSAAIPTEAIRSRLATYR